MGRGEPARARGRGHGFLTTQYLEEADVLADRVGIIDKGRIVAEDTPEALKAEIGRPSVEVTPTDSGGRTAVARTLGRFGEEIPARQAPSPSASTRAASPTWCAPSTPKASRSPT